MSEPKITIEESVMKKIKTGEVKMKSRWYFWAGSATLVVGLASLATLLLFLTHLITFVLRKHGPRGALRYEQLISNFPWWALIVMVFGVGLGIFLLKKYDFSYKKNFKTIVVVTISAILLAGVLFAVTGLDEILIKRGPVRGLYQRYGNGEMRSGPGWMFNR